MEILIGCEFSGIVRDAFRAIGHHAVSCDLEHSETKGPHVTGDVLKVIQSKRWDLGIFFPPCTYLTNAGTHHMHTPRFSFEPDAEDRVDQQDDALNFVLQIEELADNYCNAWALENPRGALSTLWRKPTQRIQPFQFGDGEQKEICLWLTNLPALVPTHPHITKGAKRIHRLPHSAGRAKERSRFFYGVASAMARQWG